MLSGFFVISVSSTAKAEAELRNAAAKNAPLDFVILDDQAECRVDDLSQIMLSLPSSRTKDTRIIHLFTPTTDNLAGTPMLHTDVMRAGVVRMTKPPRESRLLQTLASLKNVPDQMPATRTLADLRDEELLARRTLFGNVLIAEDNPVAQKLLVKQLERYDLKVVVTSNGEEAIAEWESREPGYFSVAMFDHHMPICDGVEACKRIRVLENKRQAPILLPIAALSADCQESTKQLCLSAGMNVFLSKPLKKPDLLTLLSSFGPPTAGSPASEDTDRTTPTNS